MDQLSELFKHFSVSAGIFYTGSLCGLATFNDKEGQAGHIHLLRQGEVAVTEATGESFLITEPTLLFYPKPMHHKFESKASSMADLVCATVQYGSGTNNPLTNALPERLLVPLNEMPALASFLNQLFEEADQQRNGRQVIMDRLMELVMISLLRELMENGDVKKGVLAGLAHPRLSSVLRHIHNHPDQPLGLNKLAELALMSRSSFSEIFKQVIGNSAGDYVLEWKVQVAQDLLKKGKPIQVVANTLGYSDQSAFTKAFKKKAGMSPKSWLNENTGG